MKKVLATLVVGFTVLFGFAVFAFGQIDRLPEFKAYNTYICNSHKVTNPDVASGMALAASIIETGNPGLGTVVLALVLNDDLESINRNGFEGTIDGANLILNKLGVLIECAKKCNNNKLKELFYAWRLGINRPSVAAMVREIESSVRWEYSKRSAS